MCPWCPCSAEELDAAVTDRSRRKGAWSLGQLAVCVCRCCLLDEASFNNFRGLFLFTWLAVSSLLSVVNVVRWPACSASVCSATGRCGRLCWTVLSSRLTSSNLYYINGLMVCVCACKLARLTAADSSCSHVCLPVGGATGRHMASNSQHQTKYCSLFNMYLIYWTKLVSTAQCGLRGCKNWPAPFPGRMSYKATKPGLALSVVYLSMFHCIVVY